MEANQEATHNAHPFLNSLTIGIRSSVCFPNFSLVLTLSDRIYVCFDALVGFSWGYHPQKKRKPGNVDSVLITWNELPYAIILATGREPIGC